MINSHTTTTTTTTTSTQSQPVFIRYNGLYLRTVPGILKVLCMILNIFGFISIQVSQHSYNSRGSFFCSVAMTGFWFTGFLLMFYLFQIIYKYNRVPWIFIEFWYCVVWTILYLIASTFAASLNVEAFLVAAFFGYCAMLAYGYDAFLKYRDYRTALLARHDTFTVTVGA